MKRARCGTKVLYLRGKGGNSIIAFYQACYYNINFIAILFIYSLDNPYSFLNQFNPFYKKRSS